MTPDRPSPTEGGRGEGVRASIGTGRPVLWSIAGNDSGGGAGLSADSRAADAFGVHLCPVVAAITAQNSREVAASVPVEPQLLEAQLQALEHDMTPSVIKTGLLGSAELIHVVARWIDRLRQRGHVPLVVDPVLASSTGGRFADQSTLDALRKVLLPRADLITPNRSEARALTGLQDPIEQARALRAAGAAAACVTGGSPEDGAEDGAMALDWLDTALAGGWLGLPRRDTPHTHGTGCTFATSAAAAMALGFVAADALVLAKMATAQALDHGYGAGAGAGPVHALSGFGQIPALMPVMSFDRTAPAWVAPRAAPAPAAAALYAIVDSAARVRAVLSAGVRMVQLRIKNADLSTLRAEISAGVAACGTAGARLVVNDHWRLAIELGAPAVHLGQEDLAALGASELSMLRQSGLGLGVSSHSLWELARARALAPQYIACGPVWPTETKAMPWRPQGPDNLAWWCAMAGAPVAAIGGILTAEQVRTAAACGASAICVVRGLGEQPAQSVPALLRAATDRAAGPRQTPLLPHASLIGAPRPQGPTASGL